MRHRYANPLRWHAEWSDRTDPENLYSHLNLQVISETRDLKMKRNTERLSDIEHLSSLNFGPFNFGTV